MVDQRERKRDHGEGQTDKQHSDLFNRRCFSILWCGRQRLSFAPLKSCMFAVHYRSISGRAGGSWRRVQRVHMLGFGSARTNVCDFAVVVFDIASDRGSGCNRFHEYHADSWGENTHAFERWPKKPSKGEPPQGSTAVHTQQYFTPSGGNTIAACDETVSFASSVLICSCIDMCENKRTSK